MFIVYGENIGHVDIIVFKDNTPYIFYVSGLDYGENYCINCKIDDYKPEDSFSGFEYAENKFSWTFLDNLPEEVCYSDDDCEVIIKVENEEATFTD